MNGSRRLSAGVTIDRMQVSDIGSVRYVERRCFESPWPRSAFGSELRRAPSACYLVLRLGGEVITPGNPPAKSRGVGGMLRRLAGDRDWNEQNIVGFVGVWFLVSEAHITTIAVDPDYQGLGLGRLLLLAISERCHDMGANRLTLEVRRSNQYAQAMYKRMGFNQKGNPSPLLLLTTTKTQ